MYWNKAVDIVHSNGIGADAVVVYQQGCCPVATDHRRAIPEPGKAAGWRIGGGRQCCGESVIQLRVWIGCDGYHRIRVNGQRYTIGKLPKRRCCLDTTTL